MSVPILLDQYAVPERGTFTLSVNRSVDIVVTAEEARRKAKNWLIDEISYMMTASAPTLVVGERIVWRVPAVLTAPHIGEIGVAGELDVDVETGDLELGEAHKELIQESVRQFAQAMPPYSQRADMPGNIVVGARKLTRAAGRPNGNPLDLLPER